jgi:SAM-dependent methyltransferase
MTGREKNRIEVSVHFRWEAHQFHRLLASCHRDEVVPYILRHVKRQGPILEAGCGLGRFIVFMERRGFRDVRGIDISPDAVAIVNSIAPTLNVTCGDVSNLPLDDSSIRGIVSLGVVEHFEEGPRAALREFHRVMMPGATAIITVPYLNLVRRFKHALRVYQICERMKGDRPAVPAVKLMDDVVHRSIPFDQASLHMQRKGLPEFRRWPATGPFFEYRFGIKQFEKELQAVGLSVLEIAPIDAISGLYYEFGSLLVTTSPDGGRDLTALGKIARGILARAPWIHAHMLLFVVQKPKRGSER